MARKKSTPAVATGRTVYYLERGKIPVSAADAPRGIKPTWWCHEGDAVWSTFDDTAPPPTLADTAGRSR